MDLNAVVGIVLLVISVTTVTVLTLWSRKRIDRIAESKSASAREIMQEMKNGKQA